MTSRALRLLSATALLAILNAPSAWADGASVAGDGSEGTRVDELVVTAERYVGAAAAPVKASLDATQPESIITSGFISRFSGVNADYTKIVLVAPSIAGVSSNGGGIGDTNKSTLRGFQDGQYNVTYDQISFGDTNDPTHHPADYFPASTIGAIVVDRGPGTAGDIGQANYGGALHMFSPTLSDTHSISERLSYGSWNSWQTITTIQSGAIKQTGGTKILAVADIRGSDGELAQSGGVAFNGLFKLTQPLGAHGSVTLFSAIEYTRFFQSDANLGITGEQASLYGKDFGLNNDPTSEFCACYNHEKKNTDFEYIDLRYDFGSGVTAANQAYTYFYSNKTISADNNNGLIGGPNTSTPKDKAYAATDIGGYNKGNRYRVYGDVLRVNKDWKFLTAKAGFLYEYADTDRHNILFDLSTGAPDYSASYIAANPNISPSLGNAKTIELSNWHQYQIFADFVIRPYAGLTITPGIKYVHFERYVDGAVENSLTASPSRGTVVGSVLYTKPLYFLTANYKIRPNWSIYTQYATGFLIPSLSTLYVGNLSLNGLKPSESVNYQAGTVYNAGRLTLDADVYAIRVANLQVSNAACQCTINAGLAHYSGAEGEVAYAFPFGLTLFGNGSLNTAKDVTHKTTEVNAPKWTDALGALYTYKRYQASLIWKEVGSQVSSDGPKLSSYNTINATAGYDLGHVRVKVAVNNLADHRSPTSLSGGFYTFEAGREVVGTVEAKF